MRIAKICLVISLLGSAQNLRAEDEEIANATPTKPSNDITLSAAAGTYEYQQIGLSSSLWSTSALVFFLNALESSDDVSGQYRTLSIKAIDKLSPTWKLMAKTGFSQSEDSSTLSFGIGPKFKPIDTLSLGLMLEILRVKSSTPTVELDRKFTLSASYDLSEALSVNASIASTSEMERMKTKKSGPRKTKIPTLPDRSNASSVVTLGTDFMMSEEQSLSFTFTLSKDQSDVSRSYDLSYSYDLNKDWNVGLGVESKQVTPTERIDSGNLAVTRSF